MLACQWVCMHMWAGLRCTPIINYNTPGYDLLHMFFFREGNAYENDELAFALFEQEQWTL